MPVTSAKCNLQWIIRKYVDSPSHYSFLTTTWIGVLGNGTSVPIIYICIWSKGYLWSGVDYATEAANNTGSGCMFGLHSLSDLLMQLLRSIELINADIQASEMVLIYYLISSDQSFWIVLWKLTKFVR